MGNSGVRVEGEKVKKTETWAWDLVGQSWETGVKDSNRKQWHWENGAVRLDSGKEVIKSRWKHKDVNKQEDVEGVSDTEGQ